MICSYKIKIIYKYNIFNILFSVFANQLSKKIKKGRKEEEEQ